MPLKALYLPKFKKALSKIPDKDRSVILKACHNLVSSNGREGDLTRLSDCHWRLKLHNWRVFFDFIGEDITFTDVERRTSKTYSKR